MKLNELTTGLHRWSGPDRGGAAREYLIQVPEGPVRGVALLMHPFGFTPESVLQGEAAGDLLIKPLAGFGQPAAAVGWIVIAPRSRGRILSGVSLGWPLHLEAAMDLAGAVSVQTGTEFISVGGLSMGGLEALALAGRYPDEIDAVWAVNPIVDLAAWYGDIESQRTSATLLEMGVHLQIAEEVGGSPAQQPADFAERSPISVIAGLARTRVRITWSPHDTIIPHQLQRHARPLIEAIRALGGRVEEQIITHLPASDDLEVGKYAHEACDVDSAIGWLLRQQLERSTVQ